ncbi:MAG: DUF1501 domain-containing protein [Planctomycetales bacterium]
MNQLCNPGEHVSRRGFLKGTVLTAGGAMVANWGALTSSAALAASVEKKQKKCIMLWMAGGASQFETFDMKVGRKTGGPFRPISTNLPGAEVCELLPNIAQHMDKLAVIRSMRTSQVDHPGGTYLMHTAFPPIANLTHPEIGAVCAKYLGDEGSDLPSFVQMTPGGQSGPTAGAGFLGPRFQPFSMGMEGKLPRLTGTYIAGQDEARRNELRSFLDEKFVAEHPAEPHRAFQHAYDRSRRLLNAKSVFDISKEWAKYGEKYGDSKFGRNCLLARQLVEAGVAFVEVGAHGYDTHADNFTGHKALLPTMEKAWAALLVDLQERGLLDDTLVIWMGEIGRTPYINNRAGRDHYVKAWSTALSGCGIKGGVVYGKTDPDGMTVAENPVSEGDFFATVYKALGIDHGTNHYVGLRPVPLTLQGSKPVDALFA